MVEGQKQKLTCCEWKTNTDILITPTKVIDTQWMEHNEKGKKQKNKVPAQKKGK